jgi:excisionase family DNA binding protein
MPDLDVPITATIRRFCELSGISRSRVYELLDDGSLESVYVGARRLILIDSYRKLIERQRTKAQERATARGRK